jgi:retinol dehydrogenase 12
MKPKLLILACRDLEKANAALKTIQDETKFDKIEAWQLDLASFASVQAFASRFLATGLPLDILCSNAGIGGDVLTDDGYEITLVSLSLSPSLSSQSLRCSFSHSLILSFSHSLPPSILYKFLSSC